MSKAERNVDGTDIRILTNHNAVILVTDDRDSYTATIFTSTEDIAWLITALVAARAAAFDAYKTEN